MRASQLESGRDVQRPPARQRVAADRGSRGSPTPGRRRRRCARAATRAARPTASGRSRAASAAAAATCGAANEVPIPSLNSDGPQFEYAAPGPSQPGADASTRLRGIVEKIGPPGRGDVDELLVAVRVRRDVAALSDGARRRSRAGAPPGSRRTATASSALAGRSRRRRPRGRPSTTRTRPRPPRPARTSRSASRPGSRLPPIERLITRAPWLTAQRIASTSPVVETLQSDWTTFATRSSALKAMPAIPTLLTGFAAISPATNVPWPQASRAPGAADERDAGEHAARRTRDAPASMPESITATLTGARLVGCGRPVSSRRCPLGRYHCCAASGSVLSNCRASASPCRGRRRTAAPRTRGRAPWTTSARAGHERLGVRQLRAEGRHPARMRPDGPVGAERRSTAPPAARGDEGDERSVTGMVSTDVAPVGNPCPDVHRTRYVPGTGNGRNANVPSAPAVAVATVIQLFPSLRSR